MTITITILQINQIPADPLLGSPATQHADFAIQNDAISTTWYKWSMGKIDAGADVQTVLNANASSLYTDAAASGNVMNVGTTHPIQPVTISNDSPINGLIVGPQKISTIPGSKGYFAPVRHRVSVLPGTTGSGTPPTISLGTNSPNYNNIAPATALASIGLLTDFDMRNVFINTTVKVISSDVDVFANVSVAAIGYTSYKLRTDIVFDVQAK